MIKQLPTMCFVLFAGLYALVSAVPVGHSNALFDDAESSTHNSFVGSVVDFDTSVSVSSSWVGIEANGSTTQTTMQLQPHASSAVLEYAATVTLSSSSLCNALTVQAWQDGTELYDGYVTGLAFATTTLTDPIELTFRLATATNISHADHCQLDLDWAGWQAGYPEGYTDHEAISLDIYARMVVMNEILTDPTGHDNAAMPDGEWVELYNNSATTVDIAGWQIEDATGGAWTATASTTLGTSTLIQPGGYQVIYRDGATMALNNAGAETVTLRDNSGQIIDQFTMDSGLKGEGFSWARIPDGIGAWVDPVPSPGEPNNPPLPGFPELIGSSTIYLAVGDEYDEAGYSEHLWSDSAPKIYVDGKVAGHVAIATDYAATHAVVYRFERSNGGDIEIYELQRTVIVGTVVVNEAEPTSPPVTVGTTTASSSASSTTPAVDLASSTVATTTASTMVVDAVASTTASSSVAAAEPEPELASSSDVVASSSPVETIQTESVATTTDPIPESPTASTTVVETQASSTPEILPAELPAATTTASSTTP